VKRKKRKGKNSKTMLKDRFYLKISVVYTQHSNISINYTSEISDKGFECKIWVSSNCVYIPIV